MRRAGWIAYWAFLAALVFGCGGINLDSLQWTTAVPARTDLVGEWRPGESMESVLREEWNVTAAPLCIRLEDDGTATVDGFDLLLPETPGWDAAITSLRAGVAPATSRGTWRVAVAQGGYQYVSVTVGERSVALGLWNLSPPYSLSAARDVSDPEGGGYIFFLRPADEGRRSVLAPEVDHKRDPTAGDSIWEIAIATVLWAVVLVLLVCVVIVALLALALLAAVSIAVVVATIAALAAGGALGIAATSALVGLSRRSLSSGFRTFVTLVAAVPGAAVGTAAAWVLRRISVTPQGGAPFLLDAPLLVGLLAGAVAGGLVGRFVAIALERVARWAIARFGPRSPAAEPGSRA